MIVLCVVLVVRLKVRMVYVCVRIHVFHKIYRCEMYRMCAKRVGMCTIDICWAERSVLVVVYCYISKLHVVG